MPSPSGSAFGSRPTQAKYFSCHQSGMPVPVLSAHERADRNRLGRPDSGMDTGVQNWPLVPRKFVSNRPKG